MPCSAATPPRISGLTSSSAATAITKRSKPAGRARDQRARTVGPDLVGVRDAARGEDEVAGAQRHRLAGQVQRDLAAEAVEALVLVAVDMQRRHLAGRHVHVDEAVVLAGGEHARGGAEEVRSAVGGGHAGLLKDKLRIGLSTVTPIRSFVKHAPQPLLLRRSSSSSAAAAPARTTCAAWPSDGRVYWDAAPSQWYAEPKRLADARLPRGAQDARPHARAHPLHAHRARPRGAGASGSARPRRCRGSRTSR